MLDYIYYASVGVFCSTVCMIILFLVNIPFFDKSFSYQVNTYNSQNFSQIDTFEVNSDIQQEVFDPTIIQNENTKIFLVPNGKVVFSLNKSSINLSANSSGFLYVETLSKFEINQDDIKFSMSELSKGIYNLNGKLLALNDFKINGIDLSQNKIINLRTSEIDSYKQNIFSDRNFDILTNFLSSNNISLALNIDRIPPNIQILNDTFIVYDEDYEIFGKLSESAALSINGADVQLNQGLYFSKNIKLKPGKNVFVIEATDDSGNQSSIDFEVEYVVKAVSYPLSYPLTGY